jgi:hypothetical protein
MAGVSQPFRAKPHRCIAVCLGMANFTPAYRNLLAFISSLSYTDFSTVSCSLIRELLQEATIAFKQEVYMVDAPPYTTPAIELCFRIAQETGHHNEIRLTFSAQEQLQEFHLRTWLAGSGSPD